MTCVRSCIYILWHSIFTRTKCNFVFFYSTIELIQQLSLYKKNLFEISFVYCDENKLPLGPIITALLRKKRKQEDPEEHQMREDSSSDHEVVPQNYVTCLQFLKLAYINIIGITGPGMCTCLSSKFINLLHNEKNVISPRKKCWSIWLFQLIYIYIYPILIVSV